MWLMSCSRISVLSTTASTTKSCLISLLSKPISSQTSSLVPTHEHISHLILEQKSASESLKTFKWASTLPNYTHSQSTYRALIHKLCSFRRFDNVHKLLDEMPGTIGAAPDDDIFITIIRGLGRARRIKEVVNVLDLVSKFGKNKKPTLKILNSILDVLVKEDIDLARKFYRRKIVASGFQGDDYTFGILMKGLCRTNRIGDGFKLLQVMKAGGITPNAVIYNTLLYGLCRNGKVGRARSLMSEVREPNDVTFNVMISAYCKERDLVQALVMFEKALALGFIPDVISVTKVLEILSSVGRVSEAVEVLGRIEGRGGMVDVVGHNTLIKGFCKLGKVKVARRLMKDMEMKGCLPNIDTYNTMISGYAESGMLDLALDMFNAMKTDGISWNFVTYDTLIKGMCSGGRTEDGLKILELMEDSKAGSGGRISPYNSVIYGLYKENRFIEAIDFLRKMEKLFPRAIDRSLRVLGFCEEANVEEAKRVYDQMTSEGGIPSVLVYDHLIHRFCNEGCLGEALELINEMIGHGYFPVSSTFNSLVSGFCRQGKVNSAVKLVDDIVRRGCILDSGSFCPLIEVLCKNGDFQKALKLLQQMVQNGIQPDCLVWDPLVFCLTREKVWRQTNHTNYVNILLQKVIET